MEKPRLKNTRSLEDLTSQDHEMCQLLSGLGVVFDTAKLIKLEFCAKALKIYIGTILIFASYWLPIACCLVSYPLLFLCRHMALNEKKKKNLVELLAKRRAAAVGASTSNPPPPATSAPNSSDPAPNGDRLKGVMVFVGTEDEDTSLGLVFKRQRVGDVEAPAHSAFDGYAPSLRDNPPSASSPRDLIVHEGRGRALLKITRHLLPLSSQPSSSKLLNAFKTNRWWTA